MILKRRKVIKWIKWNAYFQCFFTDKLKKETEEIKQEKIVQSTSKPISVASKTKFSFRERRKNAESDVVNWGKDFKSVSGENKEDASMFSFNRQEAPKCGKENKKETSVGIEDAENTEEETTGVRAICKKQTSKFEEMDAEFAAGASKLSALRAKMKALRMRQQTASSED